MKNNHTKTDVDVEHHHKTGKQLAYTGLATVTLVSGMGATPIVLAETLVTEQTEGVKKDRSVDDNTTDDAPVITTPDALPKTELADTPAKTDDTPKVDDSSKNAQANTEADKASEAEADTNKNTEVAPTKKAEDKNAETKVAADKKRESKTVANTDKPKTVKAKESRAGYQLQASDFDISSDGKIINGFATSFRNSTNYANWDGNLVFPSDLHSVESIKDNAFNSDMKVKQIDFSNLQNLNSLGNYAFYYCRNLVAVNFGGLKKVTSIPSHIFHYCDGLVTVNFGDMEQLTVISDYAFYDCYALTTVGFGNVPKLTDLGYCAFCNCGSLGDINLENLVNLTNIGGFGLSGLAKASIDFSKFPNLTTIGNDAISGWNNLTEVKLTNLLKLTTIGKDAFLGNISLTTVDISNLPELTSIGSYAFGSNDRMNNVNLSNLPKLTSIADYAFSGGFRFSNYNSLKIINISNLNENLIISPIAFAYSKSAGVIIPEKPSDLNIALEIRDGLNTSNNLTDYLNSNNSGVWYIPATITYNFIDKNGNKINGIDPVVDNNGIRIGDVIGGPVTAPNAAYIVKSANSLVGEIQGYINPKITNNSATGKIDSINSVITYQYDWPQALPCTVSNVDIHGNEISNTETVTLTCTVNDPLHISQLTNSDPAIQDYDFVGIRVSTDEPNVWTTIDAVPGDGYTFGENAGKNYQFVYAKRGTVTQMYLDESNNHIVLADGFDHTTLDLEDGQNYDFGDSAPDIPGYGAGHWVQIDGSAGTSGTGDGGALVVYYQYRTHAQPVTIYRVDTDGNDLGSETLSNHYIDEDLDLTPKQIDGYEYKHLFGSGTSITRVVPDLNWQAADELANTTLKYGDNAGRSYKFVYAKKATTDDSQQPEKPTTGTTTPPTGETNKPTTPTTPNEQPATPNEQPATPSKKPATGGNTEKEPGGLPISGGGSTTTGGNKNTGQQGNNKLINTTLNNNISTNTKVTNPALPQSGNTRNYLLPTLGITLIAGILSLYAFSKKRKL